MEIFESLLVGLSSGVISALLTWSVAQRRISIENITQERKKWRDNIREKSLKVHDAIVSGDQAKINRLRCEFRALLNPNDCKDNKIVKSLKLKVVENGTTTINLEELEERAEDFAERISHLLKHDWERAKLEAGPFPLKIKCIRCCILAMKYEPERTAPNTDSNCGERSRWRRWRGWRGCWRGARRGCAGGLRHG